MEKEIQGFSPELDQQLREAFSAARLRLSPDSNVSELHAFIEAQGFKATVGEFGLDIKRADNGNEVNVSTLLNAVARKQENASQFILPGAEANNLSDMTTSKQRSEYIAKHGLEAYERLVARSATELRADVVLHRDMTAEQFANLTRAEKSEFCKRYGAAAVGAALSRKVKK